MKVLILGSSGLLGSKLLDKFSKNNKTLGTFFNRAEKAKTYKNVVHLDVRQHSVVEKFIIDFGPDAVIYCSSNPRPDDCERNRDAAYEVNVSALKNAASICASLKIKFVYISSDYVFGGKFAEYVENDSRDPINFFGNTKKEAEEFLTSCLPDSLIIRSGLIFGYSSYTEGRGFLHWVVERLSAGKTLQADDSLIVFPVLADDIADAIYHLIQRNESGIYHVANNEPFTKYSFAKAIADEYGFDSSLITVHPTDKAGLPAKRPNKIHLNTDKIKNVIGNEWKVTTVDEGIRIHRRQSGCLFRLIYSVRPDMLVANQNASTFRISVGKTLAKESPITLVDCVVPIPESGIYSATGLSAESGKPLFFGLIRDYFTEKTLYSSTSKNRYEALRKKLIPVDSIVRGKSIALVDEAILSGATLLVVVQRLKEVGVREIHVRIPSPVIVDECTGRILPKIKLAYGEFVKDTKAFGSKSEFELFMTKKLGVASFACLSTRGFLNNVKDPIQQMCSDCFID